ncbi:short-chain dehydrogenase/reductase SDR [Acidovorax delafieldii 2AN]|uniref:Short-chain dehydrogenase/reductase SDR n=1 Tax=Acidovorax delafieldii 2AN TaxID=573060 RepID=C5T140_ACIDE|nr:oxidoreductase [Acidovorax delafieldii]EER61784.1 short-chain dehydrogenase/reductase SDR [Acidovorax delafieldii 2AN]
MTQAPFTQDTPVWFITGCSSGFGREIAKAVLANGWRVAMSARHADKLADLVAIAPQRALAVTLDVTQPAAIDRAVSEVQAHFGHIDALVNNAGYGYFSAIEEGEDEEIRRQFETNVFGLNRLMQCVLPGMRERRSGHIFNFSSIGGLQAFPGIGYYNASKFAVEALSESLAGEVAPLGIKVTCVEPGGFRTDWAGRSVIETKERIADYDQSAHPMMDGLKAASGQQGGDPALLAQALLAAYAEQEPPRQLLLGSDAYGMAMRMLAARGEGFERWRKLSLSTDIK